MLKTSASVTLIHSLVQFVLMHIRIDTFIGTTFIDKWIGTICIDICIGAICMDTFIVTICYHWCILVCLILSVVSNELTKVQIVITPGRVGLQIINCLYVCIGNFYDITTMNHLIVSFFVHTLIMH